MKGPVIDSSRIAVRHLQRASAADPGAVQVLGEWWAPAGSGIEGRQGWQNAVVERRVTDHGMMSATLPNAAGDDGVLHRDRFAVRTDPTYRLGTEWVEFRDADTGRPLFVGTPDTLRVDGSSVALTGVDAAGLLAGFREAKVARWTPHAPQDIVDWYSHAPRVALHEDFVYPLLTGWTTATVGLASVTASPTGTRLLALGGSTPTSNAQMRLAFKNDRQTAWRAELHGTLTAIGELGEIAFAAENPDGSIPWRMLVRDGVVYVDTAGVQARANTANLAAGEPFDLAVIATDGWMTFLVNGAVVGQLRRHPYAGENARLFIAANAAAVTTDLMVHRLVFTETVPFLRRGAPTPSYRVAGSPTPGGLRGDYYLTYDEWVRSGGDYATYGAQILAPLAEPYARRLDQYIDFSGAPPTWMPPGPPNGEGFAVRWSGSMKVNLDADQKLRLTGVDDMARMWVGDTRAGNPYIDGWGAGAVGTVTGGSLREHLGIDSGLVWVPVVIEYAQGPNGGAEIHLQETTGEGGAWNVFTREFLSPYGCWEGDLGGESHREAIDGVASTMGLAWRVQPKTLESGEFPGRLECGERLGTDTDYQLTEDDSTEYASEVAAGEAVDRVVGEAAGLGDNLGREGLTVEMVDPAVTTRPWVTTRTESLGEITEEALLQQRLSSMLALYGSPMETVAARPRGQHQLTDTFPVTGAARLFLWEPDDGIRLSLPTIGVEDRTPRRITSVSWPLTPDGRGAPAVGFRQRPKHLRATLQRLMRQTAVQRRHYQGQLAQVSGSVGGSSGGVDEYSRVGLKPGTVARLFLRVPYTNGTSTVEVHGVTTDVTVTRAGEYDITAWLPPDPTYVYARLVGTPGVHHIQLVATVRV